MLKLIEKELQNINNNNFWYGITIYLYNQHIINRKLSGVVNLLTLKIINNFYENNLIELINNKVCYINELILNNKNVEIINILNENNINACDCTNVDDVRRKFETLDTTNENYLIFWKLLPRNTIQFNPEIIITILNTKTTTATFININENPTDLYSIIPYSLNFDNNLLSLNILNKENIHLSKSIEWMKNILFNKIIKWIENNDINYEGNIINTKSLKLIDLEEYNMLYNQLKIKYGQEMVKIWPEKTDPAKFVYEDIGIASYLLLLWKKERENTGSDLLQSFVDVGCGNGLLVYILSSEGHEGYGVDLRARGIWSMYPSHVDLRVESIIPSDDSSTFSVDWIIGNHSDELSPWIPVMAARSSYETKYFVLPCCAYEFDGQKYQRRNCKLSQYNDFLYYMTWISDVCGFATSVDRLKIPSTKRVCIIGDRKEYSEHEYEERCLEIQDFINRRTGNVQNDIKLWNNDFKPREAIEKVRNCTQIDKNIINDIVRIVTDLLLQEKHFKVDFYNPNWNVGCELTLSEIVKSIPTDKLKILKSECGGVQTLLKNNHQIFQIVNGLVRLRLPVTLKEKMNNEKLGKNYTYKEKMCWFFSNHPDGCPFNDDDCSFKH